MKKELNTKDKIYRKFKEAIKDVFGIESFDKLFITNPPDVKLGDFAIPCFKFS